MTHLGEGNAYLAAVQDASRRRWRCPQERASWTAAARGALAEGRSGRRNGLVRSNKGMGLSCCGQLRGLVIGVEQDLPLEQGAQDRQQPIADAAQRASMAVPALAQRRVLPAAGWIMLNGDPRPVIEGLMQAIVAGMSPDHDAALAAAAGDRGGPPPTPPSRAISPPPRAPRPPAA